jgi:cathepsin B
MKTIITIGLLALCAANFNEYRLVNDNDFITSINNENSSWVAGHNERLADMTLTQVKRLLGTFETPEGSILPEKNVEIRTDLPENFDLREAYPDCESIKEVRDQSSCGSCWAFATVEAISDRICIASGQKLQTRISSENLVSCCSTCGFGCEGGWPIKAWKYFKDNGLPTGGLYGDNKTCQPYKFPPCDHHVSGEYGPCQGDFETPKCEKTCVNGATYKEDLWYGESAYSIPKNEEAIKTEIYNHGSVGAAFTVYEDWVNYKSGVYKYTKGKQLGGHAVKIIGWGVENGDKYWLVANSWNKGWGDNGFFKIRRGTNECGFEREITAGIPKLKKSHVSFLEFLN